jgi:pyruvate/2-oxoacid:ferredoxin oxidoreductase beta subunit
VTSFLDSSEGSPYCPGCGHPHVLRALDGALRAAGGEPHRLVLVTDIGCVGLADAQFPTLHTVHALHGRAAAVATGMQLASASARRRDGPLKPVVLVGDGGATIGLLHLVHAAQLDVDVTVLVHNNFIYGMTGGQHSGLTPTGLKTTTTPEGCVIPPLDLGQVLAGAGCGYFARARAPGDEFEALLAEGIRRPGFACVEAIELCPTFGARVGGLSGKKLDALIEERGLALGVVHRRDPRGPSTLPERGAPDAADRDPLAGGVAPVPAWARLEKTVQAVVAGRAGERVQSAAKFVAAAGASAGLAATLRTDNPVTQGRGFSMAELTLSPRPIAWTGLSRPDLAIVTAPEGLQQLQQRGLLEEPATPRRIVCDESLDLPDTVDATRAPLRKRYGPKAAALGALAAEAAGWFEPDAWSAALEALPEAQQADTRKTLSKAGLSAAE